MEKTTKRGALSSVLLTELYAGDQMKKMGGAFSTVGGRGKLHTGFCREDLRGRDHTEDIGIDRMIILKWIFKKWFGAWIGLIRLRIWNGGVLL